MKTVILAGGLGTRLSEETAIRPKPMVEIGGRPMLWHVMSIYSGYGYREFVIACGYKGEVIKEYFSDFFFHNSDLTFPGVYLIHQDAWQTVLDPPDTVYATGKYSALWRKSLLPTLHLSKTLIRKRRLVDDA